MDSSVLLRPSTLQIQKSRFTCVDHKSNLNREGRKIQNRSSKNHGLENTRVQNVAWQSNSGHELSLQFVQKTRYSSVKSKSRMETLFNSRSQLRIQFSQKTQFDDRRFRWIASARMMLPVKFRTPSPRRWGGENLQKTLSGSHHLRAQVSDNTLLACRTGARNWKDVGKRGTTALRSVKAAAVSDSRPGSSPRRVAVLMEVEGVVADVHRFGHRRGFNMAFEELGLDCAQWSEGIYADLHRAAGGVEEEMVSIFFNRIGWPTALPTNQKETFTKKVLQAKTNALEKLAFSEDIPLRPGLDTFVNELLEADVPLLVVGAYSRGGERLARLLVEKLGEERASRVRVVGEEDVERSAYGQVVLGEGVSSAMDEQLAAAASKAVAAEKQRIAEEVASLLKLSVEIETGFAHESKKVIAALRTGAAMGGVDVNRCILLASGQIGSQAASRIGMPCVVVRSSLTARAEFPAAKVVLDGYGPGSTTLPRLLKFV